MDNRVVVFENIEYNLSQMSSTELDKLMYKIDLRQRELENKINRFI